MGARCCWRRSEDWGILNLVMSLARTLAWINIRVGWRVLFWAAVLVLLAALLIFVPLFNVLGYDSGFAIGLATALAGVDIGHGTVNAARRPGSIDSSVASWESGSSMLRALSDCAP